MLDRVEMDVVQVRRVVASSRIACSQKRRCQMPRSPHSRRTVDSPSIGGKPRTKMDLIRRHRVEKSSSPGGKVQTVCRCSGSTTQASMVNRRVLRTTSNRVAQKVDVLRQQSIAPPFQQIGRKEIATTGHTIATVVWHPSPIHIGYSIWCRHSAEYAFGYSALHTVGRGRKLPCLHLPDVADAGDGAQPADQGGADAPGAG